MMSIFAPGFVAFDIVPPLQNVGKDTYRKVWEKAFTFFQDPIVFETRDLHISTGQDVAFSHQLLRLQATVTNGQKVDRWERLTFCFRADKKQSHYRQPSLMEIRCLPGVCRASASAVWIIETKIKMMAPTRMNLYLNLQKIPYF